MRGIEGVVMVPFDNLACVLYCCCTTWRTEEKKCMLIASVRFGLGGVMAFNVTPH